MPRVDGDCAPRSVREMSVSQEAEVGAGHGTELLRSAEDWPAARLEEQAGQLVEAATAILQAASHEGKLEAIRYPSLIKYSNELS